MNRFVGPILVLAGLLPGCEAPRSIEHPEKRSLSSSDKCRFDYVQIEKLLLSGRCKSKGLTSQGGDIEAVVRPSPYLRESETVVVEFHNRGNADAALVVHPAWLRMVASALPADQDVEPVAVRLTPGGGGASVRVRCGGACWQKGQRWVRAVRFAAQFSQQVGQLLVVEAVLDSGDTSEVVLSSKVLNVGRIGFEIEGGTVVPKNSLEAHRVSGSRRVLFDSKTRQLLNALPQRQRYVRTNFRFCVDQTGRVSEVTFSRATTYPSYDRKLKSEILGWRFEPFLIGGKAAIVCANDSLVNTW